MLGGNDVKDSAQPVAFESNDGNEDVDDENVVLPVTRG